MVYDDDAQIERESALPYREPMPGESRFSPEIDRLKEVGIEAAAKALHLLESTNGEVGKRGVGSDMIKARIPGYRSGDSMLIREGCIEQLSLNRIVEVCDALGCRLRHDVIPPVVKYRVDDRTYSLFKLLEAADRECQSIAPDIGRRSYPMTGFVVRHAGTQCLLAIDAIRSGPEFWYREAHLFSAMLYSAQALLERVKIEGKQWKVRRVTDALKRAAEAMEDLAEQIADERNAVRQTADA